jgi:excisionase family DNA binding protein
MTEKRTYKQAAIMFKDGFITTAQAAIMFKDGFITTAVAAEAIGVNVSTVYRWVKTEHIEGKQVGRSWYVRVAELIEKHEGAPSIQQRLKDLNIEEEDDDE